jgi:hypothetical protein
VYKQHEVIDHRKILKFELLIFELKKSSEIMMADPVANGTHESQSGSDTYASIKKGTYALKRDFNASTRYCGKNRGNSCTR